MHMQKKIHKKNKWKTSKRINSINEKTGHLSWNRIHAANENLV